jgi:hypothetical protein
VFIHTTRNTILLVREVHSIQVFVLFKDLLEGLLDQSRTVFESSKTPGVMEKSLEFIVVNVIFKLSQESSDEITDEDHFSFERAKNGEKDRLYCSEFVRRTTATALEIVLEVVQEDRVEPRIIRSVSIKEYDSVGLD